MFLIAILTTSCNDVIFQEEPELPGAVVRISQRGLQNYVMANFEMIEYYLNVVKFPNLKLSVMGIDIILQDILTTAISAGGFVTSFDEASDSANVELSDMTMHLSFNFRVQQKTYPYLEDHGTGKMLLDNLTITAILSVIESPNCLRCHRINVVSQSADMRIGGLRV